jgi:ABC-2 type transport system ATP-binding protein
MQPVISVKNVSKTYKDVKAVNDISLDIRPGEYVALLGPNGAGKTTLMEMIEGIRFPDQGQVLIKGLSWKGHGKKLHNTIGISLQETHFFDKLKVGETLSLFASFYNLDNERINEILKLINLEEKRKAAVKNLSGGQKQRLAIGIALLNKPEVLLLDEPTTGLDPGARRELWDILFRLRTENNMTMILTTHYMEEADYLCERIVIMDKGNILAQGTVEELLATHNNAEIIEFTLEGDGPFEVPQQGMHTLEKDEKTGTWKLRVDDIISYLPSFLEVMKRQNREIKTLECHKMTLEDLFISMTGRSLND